MAIAGVGCAWLFRGRALRVVERAPRITEPAEADRALRDIQTWLLVAWALSEAPALFSGALLLMNGNTRIALAGVLALAIGMLGIFLDRDNYRPQVDLRSGIQQTLAAIKNNRAE